MVLYRLDDPEERPKARRQPRSVWTPDLWRSRPTRERGNCLINATETIRYSCGKNEIEFLPQIINKSHLWKTRWESISVSSLWREACLNKTRNVLAVKHKIDKFRYVNRQTLLTKKPIEGGGQRRSKHFRTGAGGDAVGKELAKYEHPGSVPRTHIRS